MALDQLNLTKKLFTIIVQKFKKQDAEVKWQLKVYSNELFLFQLMNDLCKSFTKIVIIFFLSKAVFIKKNFVVSIFCAKNRTTIKVLF